ncbi:hypothetical protein ACXVUM_03475 [Williamsia sp. SKLECPSW1]
MSGALSSPVTTKTANYTALDTDGTILANGVITITLPTPAAAGRIYRLKNITSGSTVTVPPTTGTIDGQASASLSALAVGRYQWDGANWWAICDRRASA